MKFDLIFLLIPKMQLLVNISVRIIGYTYVRYPIYKFIFSIFSFTFTGQFLPVIIEAGYSNPIQIYCTKHLNKLERHWLQHLKIILLAICVKI